MSSLLVPYLSIDFREIIIPYLISDDDEFESKKLELLEYKEVRCAIIFYLVSLNIDITEKQTLQGGQSLVSDFLDDLESVAQDLEEFKDKVTDLGNEDVVRQVKKLKDRFLILRFRYVSVCCPWKGLLTTIFID